MRIVSTKDIDVQKEAAANLLGAGVDAIIARLMGTGRMVMFQRAVDEARMVQANPSIAATEVPLLAAEATARSITIPQMAVRVGNKYKKLADAMAIINRREVIALNRIADATQPSELQFVYDLDWEALYQQAKDLAT